LKDDLVTIRRFHFVSEAEVVRGFLETSGIPCFVANQIIASHRVAFGYPQGAVCLQVREQDIESAEELLQRVDGEGSEAFEPGSEELSSMPPGEQQNCPCCGMVWGKRAARECLNCGYRR